MSTKVTANLINNIAPSQIQQAGATTGQNLTWNGTAWAAAAASGGLQFLGTKNAGLTLTGIPSTARILLIAYVYVKTSGAYHPLFRLGSSSSVFDSNYNGSAGAIVNGGVAGTIALTDGFKINMNDSVNTVIHNGQISIIKVGDDFWVASGVNGQSNHARMGFVGGTVVAVDEVVDRVALVTSSPTGTFDDGFFSVYYA